MNQNNKVSQPIKGNIINRIKLKRRQLLKLAAGSLAVPGALLTQSCLSHSQDQQLTGEVAPVHDPCIIKANDLYHIFSTGHLGDSEGLLAWRTSKDLVHWELKGSIFEEIPQWVQKAVPGTRGIWAPDIAYFNGRFHLYYSCSTFGSNHSVIGLVTNATLDSQSPDYEWQDQGLALRSQRGDKFNAIDANHLEDNSGRHWLSFGSFWSGIKILEINPETGKPLYGMDKLFSIASRPAPEGAPGAVEAPFIIERQGYYYLFASYDYCCRGVNSSYYIVVGRSEQPTGPYVGSDGKPMTEGYGNLLLRGNSAYRGPGHNAFLRDGNKDYLVYHAYDTAKDGMPTLRIAPVSWSKDGWPLVN